MFSQSAYFAPSARAAGGRDRAVRMAFRSSHVAHMTNGRRGDTTGRIVPHGSRSPIQSRSHNRPKAAWAREIPPACRHNKPGEKCG
jgi:hypothetical protein